MISHKNIIRSKYMRKSGSFNWLKVFAVSFSHLMHDIYGGFLAPLMPLLKEKIGFGNTVSGLLFAAQRLPSFFSPFIGIVADRKGLKWMVIVTPAVTAVCMSLLGISPTLFFLFLFVLVAGISSAVYHVPSPVMIRNASGKRTGLGMSLYMVGGESARFLGPLLIAGSVSLYGLEGSWVVMFLGIVASFLLYIIFRNHVTPVYEKKSKLYTFSLLKRHAGFFVITAGFLFWFGIMKAMLVGYLPIYIVDSGGTFSKGAYLLALVQGAGIPGTFFSGIISDKLGRKTTLLIVALLTPVLFLSYVNTTGWLSIVFLLFLGFVIISPAPVILSMVQSLSSEKPAFLNSMYMAVNFLFSSLALLLIGMLTDIFDMNIVYQYAPLAGIPAIIMILLYKK